MDKKNTSVILGIVIIAIIGFVAISFQHSNIDTKDAPGTVASTTDWTTAPAEHKPAAENAGEKIVVTAKHAYQNDQHVIAGEIPLPTPCHILETASTVSSDKKHVFIAFTSSIKTGEMCAEKITPARFKVTVKAAKNSVITATLNGKDVTLNLIEAGPNENLDNFELYIKG